MGCILIAMKIFECLDFFFLFKENQKNKQTKKKEKEGRASCKIFFLNQMTAFEYVTSFDIANYYLKIKFTQVRVKLSTRAELYCENFLLYY